MPRKTLRIAATFRSRAEIAAQIVPALYAHVQMLGFSSDIAYGMARAVDLCHLKIQADYFDQRPMNMGEFCRGGEGGPLTIPLHRGAKKYYLQKGYL